MLNQLKPGPSIDKVIAEKVMGWQVSDYSNIGIVEIETEDEMFLLDEFKPSSNIKDAWEIVKKFKESRFSVRKGFINELQQLVTPEELKASGNLLHESELIYYLTPFSICIGALKSIGMEVQND